MQGGNRIKIAIAKLIVFFPSFRNLDFWILDGGGREKRLPRTTRGRGYPKSRLHNGCLPTEDDRTNGRRPGLADEPDQVRICDVGRWRRPSL